MLLPKNINFMKISNLKFNFLKIKIILNLKYGIFYETNFKKDILTIPQTKTTIREKKLYIPW